MTSRSYGYLLTSMCHFFGLSNRFGTNSLIPSPPEAVTSFMDATYNSKTKQNFLAIILLKQSSSTTQIILQQPKLAYHILDHLAMYFFVNYGVFFIMDTFKRLWFLSNSSVYFMFICSQLRFYVIT